MNPYSNGPATARTNGADQHIPALSEALITNWSSRDFSKFVDVCRTIVDELANAENNQNSGLEQLLRCEGQYQQVLFLWERIWPEVNGMGEQSELGDTTARDSESTEPEQTDTTGIAGPSGTNGTSNSVDKGEPIEIDDDDDDENGGGDDDAPNDPADSPYGGTGLGAIAAANSAV